MKMGIVISMYDEIDIVKENISNLRKYDSKIIVIQSDPGNEKMKLDRSLCDKYEIMSDIAGGREKYSEIIEEKKEGKRESIGPIALSRNFSRGFTLIKDYEIDYVIGITGDVKIKNLNGILKIIKKMKKDEKLVGGTRHVGYTMYDEFGEFTQFQHRKITNIMPQFFLANIESIKKGLFCNIKRTNKFTTEQCIGDEIVRYGKENNLGFFEIFYRISDTGSPRFIDGLHYNPGQISKIPQPFEKIINLIRYWSNERINAIITKIFLRIENRSKR